MDHVDLAPEELLQLLWEKHGIDKQIEEHLADARPISTLRDPAESPDEELIKDRYLCRGGAMLFPGTTGAGKSSLIMQGAMLWALNRPLFDVRPARALRTLIVQAENDEGDLWEQTHGVFRGIGFTDEEKALINERVWVIQESQRTGAELISFLKLLLSRRQYDILVLDPLFAFLGGDANSSKDSSAFLRNLLNPLLLEYRIGLILIHHFNKPARTKDTPQWKGLDFAYSGSGSAEHANWARAVMVLRSLGDPNTYELRAAKRGKRLGWKDANGQPAFTKMISHSSEPGVICWREATAEEASAVKEEEGKGNKKADDIAQEIADIWRFQDEEITHDEFIKRSKDKGIAQRTAYYRKKIGISRGLFKITSEGMFKLTGKVVCNVPVSSEVEEDFPG